MGLIQGHGVTCSIGVAEPPVDGRANQAVCRAVAGAFGVPTRSVTVTAGARSADKTVQVEGDPDALAARLAGLLGP